MSMDKKVLVEIEKNIKKGMTPEAAASKAAESVIAQVVREGLEDPSNYRIVNVLGFDK